MSDLDKQLEAAATLMRSDADQSIALLVEVTRDCPEAIVGALAIWEGIEKQSKEQLLPICTTESRVQMAMFGILSRFVRIGASAVADSVQAQAKGETDGH